MYTAYEEYKYLYLMLKSFSEFIWEIKINFFS